MRKLMILAMVLSLLIPFAAFAENGEQQKIPDNPFNVQPIPPDELTAKATQIGENVVNLGQGLAPAAMWIAFIVAAFLIFFGLPLMGISKKFFMSGVMLLIGMFVMYVLVFYPGQVIGAIKGVFGAG